jgi:hypothetical protein
MMDSNEAFAANGAGQDEEGGIPAIGLEFPCPNCGFVSAHEIPLVVLEDSEEFAALREGKLNVIHCPQCDTPALATTPFVLFQEAEKRIVCFVPNIREMQPQEQQQLIGELVQALQMAGVNLEVYQIAGNQLQVAVVDEYEAMVVLANGGGEMEKLGGMGMGDGTMPDIDPATLQMHLATLLQMVQADPLQRISLINAHKDKVAELAMVAELIIPQLPPEAAPQMRDLAKTLRERASAS